MAYFLKSAPKMYNLVIYKNNEVFEPYVETTSTLRDTVKKTGGQFNVKSRRYQMPINEYDNFLTKLAEDGLIFTIVSRELPVDKAGSKGEAKKENQVEIRMYKDHFQMHLIRYSQEIVDLIKTLPVRNYMTEDERRWWQSPIDEYQQLCDLFIQNNISFQVVTPA